MDYVMVNGYSMKSIQDFVNMNVHMLLMYRFNALETKACVNSIQYVNTYSGFTLQSGFMDIINEIDDNIVHSPAGYRYDLAVLQSYYSRYNTMKSYKVTYYVG